MAADAGIAMGFQSIFAWKALPEAAFVKKAVIDTHRSKHESIASGWLHGSARPILPQASPVWKVRNLPHCCLRARESVRRASGFVQIPIALISVSYFMGCEDGLDAGVPGGDIRRAVGCHGQIKAVRATTKTHNQNLSRRVCLIGPTTQLSVPPSK